MGSHDTPRPETTGAFWANPDQGNETQRTKRAVGTTTYLVAGERCERHGARIEDEQQTVSGGRAAGERCTTG